MLTEPKMQARYLAATLGVIETELRNPDTTSGKRRALSVLIASASRTASRLAEDLERRGGATIRAGSPSAASQRRDNVVAFKR